jgi:hypothetical protein
MNEKVNGSTMRQAEPPQQPSPEQQLILDQVNPMLQELQEQCQGLSMRCASYRGQLSAKDREIAQLKELVQSQGAHIEASEKKASVEFDKKAGRPA